MKKSILVFVAAFICILNLFSQSQAEDVLTVYAYDSFVSEWGPGNAIVSAFEEQTGIKVNLVGSAGAVQMYQKIQFEGNDCPADLAIGFSDQMNVDSSLFSPFTLECFGSLKPELIDLDSSLVPFDWGLFAFIADTEKIEEVPTCLEDLTKENFKDKVILIDPRTSSVGLGLLLWTIESLGEERAFQWWAEMKENALTIADSWSSAYGLFTEGEAPLVISYTTSPVYHVMYEDTTRFQALEFTDGHRQTVEYLGILATSDKKEEAKQFANFVLTQGQKDIAVANTMFPANSQTILPEAFAWALTPSVILDEDYKAEKVENWLSKWATVMLE